MMTMPEVLIEHADLHIGPNGVRDFANSPWTPSDDEVLGFYFCSMWLGLIGTRKTIDRTTTAAAFKGMVERWMYAHAPEIAVYIPPGAFVAAALAHGIYYDIDPRKGIFFAISQRRPLGLAFHNDIRYTLTRRG